MELTSPTVSDTLVPNCTPRQQAPPCFLTSGIRKEHTLDTQAAPPSTTPGSNGQGPAAQSTHAGAAVAGGDPNEILRVEDLKTYFYTEDGIVKAVDGISFSLRRGQTMGLVGESGCGKSVTSLSIMRLIGQPGKIVEGKIWFNGKDLTKLTEEQMCKIRGDDISMIFQQPTSCLNPVFRVGDQISEVLMLHRGMNQSQAMKRTIELLSMVGIPAAARRAQSYPHEMSGGMCQRVMIAMALACEPELLIADEPTTALDVTIQAQILELMKDLKANFNTAIILITHDLGVVAVMADHVAVMYAGK